MLMVTQLFLNLTLGHSSDKAQQQVIWEDILLVCS